MSGTTIQPPIPQRSARQSHERPPGQPGDETRRRWLDHCFDTIAPNYDRVDSMMSAGTGPRYRAQRLRSTGLAAGMSVLDVGCGTGVVARIAEEIVGSTGRVVAVDPSPRMLEQTRRRGVREVVQGVAEELPFADETFDVVVMSYALRHVANLHTAFIEFHRVLRPGGRVLILEISAPPQRLAYGLLKVYLKHLVPAATWLATGSAENRNLMRYYWETIDASPSPAAIVSHLHDAGFEDAARRTEFAVLNEYTGRRAATPSTQAERR